MIIKLNLIKNSIIILLILLLVSCGGGGNNPRNGANPAKAPVKIGGGGGNNPRNGANPAKAPVKIGGGGVDGPLIYSIVKVYKLDTTKKDNHFKGNLIATGSTDAKAAITGLALPFPLTPPYIMEFTSDANTKDITTRKAPIIKTMRTVITQIMLDSGKQIYATPLTNMVVDLAIQKTNSGVTTNDFITALELSQNQVKSTFGFGLDDSVDIFTTPPIINNATTTKNEQTKVAQYRAAVEAITAIAYQINQQSSDESTTVDDVLSELVQDLKDGEIDGKIDGKNSKQINANTLQILNQDPKTLPIPNDDSGRTVGDIQAILTAEKTDTRVKTATTELETGGSIDIITKPAETNPDIDGDGVFNSQDAFPNDATETKDSDNDGIGDNKDTNDDNDGYLDNEDDYPFDATRFLNPDLDRDNDGVKNSIDNCVFNANLNQTDTDGNGIGDACSDDKDGDGINNDDNCPNTFNPSQVDTDSDTYGNACDDNDDNDNVVDDDDAFPLNDSETIDTDGDGIGDNTDNDKDGDGVLNIDDTGIAPSGTPNAGIACNLLRDCDGDGVFDKDDYAPQNPKIKFNFAPIVKNISIPTIEDNPVGINITASDDGATNFSLTYTVITAPSNGVLTGTKPQLTYTPNANFNGTDSFTFKAYDGDKYSNIATVTITISSVNDIPIINQGDSSITIILDEDKSLTFVLFSLLRASDADTNDTLTWSLVSNANKGIASVSGTGLNPIISYMLNLNANGSDSFTIKVSDNNGGSASIIIKLTINAINDAPTISGTPVTQIKFGNQYTFTPIANDVDNDNDTLTFIIENQPSWANFNHTTGALTGTPTPTNIDTGVSKNIIISVSDSVLTAKLPSFNIGISAGVAKWNNFNWDDGSTWQ